MSDAIVIQGLTKTFGPKVAVQSLDLRIPTGSLCGFIGPNGAGKTTTIRMVMSIIFPDSGQLSVLGKASAIESKDRIGYLPEERGVYKKMKVVAFLTYMAKLKGVDPAAAKGKAMMWLEKVGLQDAARKKCEELSKGMQQKVQFIAAVMHEPDLLILDEVFSGLDPVNRRLMRQLIEEQNQSGRTVIFSTHAMYEAEQLCDRVFMIHDGHKVLDATLDEIRAEYDPRTIVVEPLNGHDGQTDAYVHSLQALPGVSGAARQRDLITLNLAPHADLPQLMSRIPVLVPLRRLELERVSLEDVFINLVTASGGSIKRDDLRAAAASLDQEN